jgi:4-amino-4-deoxy-L-arabinose transferase-like glycosyltransferase
LEYPLKLDYYGAAPYEALRSQATQHPPLFPFLAGVLSKLTGNGDTFTIAKYICFVMGLVVLRLVLALARVTPSSIPVALVLASFMPLMVDFSGNGSPYIMLAAILCSVTLLLVKFKPNRPGHYALLGSLLALGYMVHGSTVFAVPGVLLFLALNIQRLRPTYLLIMIASGLLTLTPLVLWNLSYQENLSIHRRLH